MFDIFLHPFTNIGILPDSLSLSVADQLRLDTVTVNSLPDACRRLLTNLTTVTSRSSEVFPGYADMEYLVLSTLPVSRYWLSGDINPSAALAKGMAVGS